MRRDVALVTGASRGLGREIARALARRGVEPAVTARDAGELATLADELAAAGAPRPIIVALDLAAPDAPAQLAARLDAEGARLTALVNNAGYGLVGEAATLDRPAQLGMIDLNIRALTDLTLHMLPRLIATRGRILNVASVAGFAPGPGMAVYYASKAYVISFGDALGAELAAEGVSVTTLCPGPLDTPFWSRAGAAPGPMRRLASLDVAAVAEAGVAGMFAGRRRVTPGALNALAAGLAPCAPRAMTLAIARRMNAARRRAAP
ncbi:MAG: SDR family NAD(P)-dependent oxidoreductase [Methylobacteriaceae bacterium]|nr:SDR family NAD(P)-dependent oxidoreductase [Methylobacteriaceae bacterium]